LAVDTVAADGEVGATATSKATGATAAKKAVATPAASILNFCFSGADGWKGTVQ
jgi:hypothetical protein